MKALIRIMARWLFHPVWIVLSLSGLAWCKWYRPQDLKFVLLFILLMQVVASRAFLELVGSWVLTLPVRPVRAVTAWLIVFGGAWIAVSTAAGLLWPGGPSAVHAVNVCLLGLALLCSFEVLACLESLVSSSALKLVVFAIVIGAAVGTAGNFVLAGPQAAPWLFGAFVLLLSLALATARCWKLAEPRRGARDGERSQRDPGEATGPTRFEARGRRPRSPIRSCLHVAGAERWIVLEWPLAILIAAGWICISPWESVLAARIGALFVLYGTIQLGSSMGRYRSLFAFPLPRARAFRIFFLPWWSLLVLCVGLRAASSVLWGIEVPVAIADAAAVALLVTAGTLSLAPAFGPVGRQRWGFLPFALLAVSVTVLPFGPSWVVRPWSHVLQLGGGAGAWIAAALAAAATILLLREIRRRFDRLEWTDLQHA